MRLDGRGSDRRAESRGRQTAGKSKARDMRAGKENGLPTGYLPQQRVLGGAEVRMRTELERITGRWTDCGEEN